MQLRNGPSGDANAELALPALQSEDGALKREDGRKGTTTGNWPCLHVLCKRVLPLITSICPAAMASRAAALLALAALLPLAAGDTSIRGLNPALAPRYQADAQGQFTCLDGKKRLPANQINDGYCDCFDGSDEPGEECAAGACGRRRRAGLGLSSASTVPTCPAWPHCNNSLAYAAGTAACANGHFYCENKFFLPLLLNSSMVDDGVCGEGLASLLSPSGQCWLLPCRLLAPSCFPATRHACWVLPSACLAPAASTQLSGGCWYSAQLLCPCAACRLLRRLGRARRQVPQHVLREGTRGA